MRDKKSRRGSVLVLVALMLVAIMGVGAIVADIGRFYVVTGELQTAADAAALYGASTLQARSAADPPPAVKSAVNTFSLTANKVDGGVGTIAQADVNLGYWTPGTGTTPGTFD